MYLISMMQMPQSEKEIRNQNNTQCVLDTHNFIDKCVKSVYYMYKKREGRR